MDLPMFRRIERQASRMHEMMSVLDVDPLKLTRLRDGEAYAEARTRCLFCGTSDTCLRWLDQLVRVNKRPEFCPNLFLFEACQRENASAFVHQQNASHAA